MKKKILFVINTLGHAGAEVAMLELMRRFPSTDYALSVYVILGQGELRDELPEHAVLLNRDYKAVPVLSREGRREIAKTVWRRFWHHGGYAGKLSYVMKNYLAMKRQHAVRLDKLLWRILSDGGEYPGEEFDLAIACLEGAATYFVADHVRAAKKAAFVHIDYRSAGYGPGLDLGCYDAYDRIFAISDEVKEHFLEVYPKYRGKTAVFHNIINTERIRAMATAEGGFADSFAGVRILTVGRLTYQKAYDIAIRAMKLLKDEGHPVRWYVLGDGDMRSALERQILSLGLTEDFVLLGAVKNPYPYYRQCDLYVHATRFEGKSIAIAEAMTLGCAVVASDCNGNREYIRQEENGLLCGLTPEAIRDAVVRLIGDEGLRNRLAACAAAEDLAGGDEELHLLMELLQEE